MSQRKVNDAALGRVIFQLFQDNYQCYGRRKLWHALRRQGFTVGRDSVARIMKLLGIQGKTRGRGRVTTWKPATVDHRQDLVQRQFTAMKPNQLWVADMTYVRIRTGFAYTAFITDVCTRKIVGWAVAGAMSTTVLPLQALQHAINGATSDLHALVHHADHGSQYCSLVYSEHLTQAGIASSTGSVGDSYDNALAETVNGLYKTELIYPHGTWNTAQEVELATMSWVH